MNREEALAELGQQNPDALLADGLEDALVGYAQQFSNPPLAVYDMNKVLQIFVKQGMTHEEAIEHFEFNVIGAWMGPHTPMFMEPVDDED